MTRDNFSAKTRFELAYSVNFQCAKPGCSIVTHYPKEDFTGSINVGVAAHKSAAAFNGPRFDDQLTIEQRRAADNGVHLCANHAREVDVDFRSFPISLLTQWQQQKMLELRQNGGQRVRFGTANVADVNREATNFLALCRQIRLSISPSSFCVDTEQTASMYQVLIACMWQAPFEDGGRPSPNWRAGTSYHAHDSFAVDIQKNVISTLATLYGSIKSTSQGWYYDSGIYWPVGLGPNGIADPWARPQQQDFWAVIQLASERCTRFHSEIQSLQRYISEPNTRTSV